MRATRWLRHTSTSHRLQAAFALLLGLLMTVAVLSGWRLYRYQQVVEELAVVAFTRIRLSAEINANTDRATRQMLTLVTGERALRVAAYQEIDLSHRRIDDAVTALRERTTESRRINPLVTALANYRAAYNETVDLIEADDSATAFPYFSQRTEPAIARLSQVAEQLAQEEQAMAQQAALHQAEVLRRDLLLLAGICLLALLLGALMSRLVRRSITVPLSRTQKAALRIAAGDYETRAQVRGSDEVTGVADALNQLAVAVSEREAEIRRLIDVDALTGLAQRTRFLAETQSALAAAPDQAFALACLDLERLKAINALVGFETGDAALVQLAQRLREAAPAPQPLARLGGGTFAVLLPLPAGVETGLARAHALRTRVEGLYSHAGQDVDLQLSLGLVVHQGAEAAADLLLRRAEHAMHEAKRLKIGAQVFDASLEQHRKQELALASALQAAVAQDELRLHLQPKLALADGTLQGAEALLRWQHPLRGLVPPGDFIPFAERTGRLPLLTRWVLEEAVRLLAQAPALAGLSLAVNLSTQDLLDATLPERVQQLLARHGVAAARLTLEITESGLMAAGDEPVKLLQRLRVLGVKLSIDDFGTGQSSLAYLQRLPVHELKIDRSFVREVDGDAHRLELLGIIVRLGHSLGLSVTAEGVEREAEHAALKALGADTVQGYLTGRPMAVADFEAWRSR